MKNFKSCILCKARNTRPKFFLTHHRLSSKRNKRDASIFLTYCGQLINMAEVEILPGQYQGKPQSILPLGQHDSPTTVHKWFRCICCKVAEKYKETLDKLLCVLRKNFGMRKVKHCLGRYLIECSISMPPTLHHLVCIFALQFTQIFCKTQLSNRQN